MKFPLRLLCISINLPYDHPWNTVVMSGLMPLVATWNFSISYKSGYVGLSVFHLLHLLKLLAYRRNVASLSLFCRYYFRRCSSEHAQLVPRPFFEGGILVVLIDCMIFLSPFLDVARMSMSTVSFVAQLGSGILCLKNPFL